ncbi:MAG: LEA type 2 family protein [Phycisphaerales bacterium]|nr:LEA type 2 family protein [Phycisphaerales bacterium]
MGHMRRVDSAADCLIADGERNAGRVKFGVLAMMLAVLSLVSGCGVLGKPSANIVDATLTDLSLEGVTVSLKVDVRNPYPIAVPLTDVEYALSSKRESIVTGVVKNAGSIPARGSKTLDVPLRVKFADVLSAVEGLRLGAVVPYAVNMKFELDVPGGEKVSIPVTKEGEMPIPNVPDVRVNEVRWDEISVLSAKGLIRLDVTNTNEFEVGVAKMAYSMSVGGTKVVSGRVSDAASLSAGETETIEIPVKISPASLGLAVMNMLKSNKASYEIVGDLGLETRFGNFEMPTKRFASK